MGQYLYRDGPHKTGAGKKGATMKIDFHEAKRNADEALDWVHKAEAFVSEHPDDEQALDELDLARANYTWTLQHPDWPSDITPA